MLSEERWFVLFVARRPFVLRNSALGIFNHPNVSFIGFEP